MKSASALALVILFSAATVPARGGPRSEVQIDATWNQVFARSHGWTGGDVAGTVDLGDGRTAWVFGDTWIGEVRDGKHAGGSQLINNSVAVHHHTPDGTAPAADAVQFLGGRLDADGRPMAWVIPERRPSTDEESRPTWYWPNGGGAVVPGDKDARRRLIVFLFHVARRAGGEGVWNFQVIGGAMAVVDNVADPPAQWRPRVVSLPESFTRAAAGASAKPGQTSWGVAACLDNESSSLYLYGVGRGAERGLVLARVCANAVEDFGQWRFFAGCGRWSEQPADAISVIDNVPSELSVSWSVDSNGRRTLLMVHSEPLFGARILTRAASRFEGPWSPPEPVYSVPELARNKAYFTYAAKGHPHLSRSGELLVSYIVNSHDFGAMVSDASIYRPKFVRVPLSRIHSRR